MHSNTTSSRSSRPIDGIRQPSTVTSTARNQTALRELRPPLRNRRFWIAQMATVVAFLLHVAFDNGEVSIAVEDAPDVFRTGS